MRDDFCVFILCYKRPTECKTLHSLQHCGYTGKYYLVVGDDDPTVSEYQKNFGEDKVLVFNKDDALKLFDPMDNFNNRKCVVYARNICFKLAEDVGVKYFCELDDDYREFQYRYPEDGRLSTVDPTDMDALFEAFIEYFESCPTITSIAFAQGGDFLGGLSKSSYYHKKILRKAMNSFICCVDRPFVFNGTLNEDVNTYTTLTSRGCVFLTLTDIMVNQEATQQSKGVGMSDIYEQCGTYTKSFYTILCNPQTVKISILEAKHTRMHHNIDWERTAPKILSSKFRNY